MQNGPKISIIFFMQNSIPYIYFFDLRVKSVCFCKIYKNKKDSQEVEKPLLLGTEAFTVNCSRCLCNYLEITVDRRNGKGKGFDIEQRS